MWDVALLDPLQTRKDKPRSTGITMVMDKGIGLNAFKDLLQVSSSYIDFIKLGFGTPGLTPVPVLKEKIGLAKDYDIPIYPGGTFFEVAKAKNRLDSYFQNVLSYQFEWVEISDGSIFLSANDRKEAIKRAKEYGLNVVTEIGKKAKDKPTSLSTLLQTYEQDISDGSSYVIIEGRESGENLSIFDKNGELDIYYIEEVIKSIGSTHLIWEATQKHQQVQLLNSIGSEVNFGNISPNEILSVECLRRGLRSDTLNLLSLSHNTG